MSVYPLAPGRKFETDVDGSVGFGVNTTEATPFSGTAMTNLSKTVSGNSVLTGGGQTTYYVGYLFPELRDIAGFCLINQAGVWGSWDRVYTSTDSTNGTDGTWTDRGAMSGSGSFRTITALVVAGVKGIRFRWSSTSTEGGNRYLGLLHIYGSIPSSSSPDRLTLWHPSSNVEFTGSGFDFGDVPRLTVATISFRVKNNSSTQTANTITVSVEAVNDTSPTVVGVETLDFNGSGYASTQNIGSLAAGVISAICTLKLSPSITATLGPWRQRVKAVAVSWT